MWSWLGTGVGRLTRCLHCPPCPPALLLLLLLLLLVQGAAHPPSTGAGAVGWRVQLYWPADGMWHEAEVLSYNEVRRMWRQAHTAGLLQQTLCCKLCSGFPFLLCQPGHLLLLLLLTARVDVLPVVSG